MVNAVSPPAPWGPVQLNVGTTAEWSIADSTIHLRRLSRGWAHLFERISQAEDMSEEVPIGMGRDPAAGDAATGETIGNFEKYITTITGVAAQNPLCLDEPAPLFLFKDFGEYSINMLFAVWFEKSHFLDVKNSIFLEIKERFDREGIEIPFPHVTLYTGSATAPFPVDTGATNRRKFRRSSSSRR